MSLNRAVDVAAPSGSPSAAKPPLLREPPKTHAAPTIAAHATPQAMPDRRRDPRDDDDNDDDEDDGMDHHRDSTSSSLVVAPKFSSSASTSSSFNQENVDDAVAVDGADGDGFDVTDAPRSRRRSSATRRASVSDPPRMSAVAASSAAMVGCYELCVCVCVHMGKQSH
jgi:hypothetical protein